MWKQLWQGALEMVFPARCAVCGAYGSLLCGPCREALPRALPPRCALCWRVNTTGYDEVCPSCREARPAFEGARAPYCYEGPVRQLLWALKYEFVTALAAPLATLMAQYLEEQRLPAPDFDLLAAVPLHPRRRRERGYNQAALLARDLSRLLGCPWDDAMLRRAKAGPPQARSASIEERQRNVVGAFVADAQRAPGRRVLLIDDVMTSGATLNACARALKDAGAASVWALTIARD
ncbi:MAG TPA: ComF family protein [Dehalococcoidia bacterium]|nr:ComF family protein [Dehalococcoidia bacterium]HLB29100.1 ComF family protein [Dehalococcoidia bacterium]